MNKNESIPSDSYAFDPREVVGDDLNVLQFHIPGYMGKLALDDVNKKEQEE